MKTLSGGKIKLEKNDFRIGNFVLSIEKQHVKVCDINKRFTLRFFNRMPIGVWLDSLVKRGDDGLDSLRTYIVVLWSVLSVVPDSEYLQELIKSAHACMARHADWYGKKEKEDGKENTDDCEES